MNPNKIKYLLKFKVLFLLFILAVSANLFSQASKVIYLSGKDAENTKEWDFYCSAGRQSGFWTKIPVPSCWELEGFGSYDYGRGNPFENRLKEEGLYKYSFFAEANWKGEIIDLVFDGVMTDCEVKINGQIIGEAHQGAFYQFKYKIDRFLKYGKQNLLEVHVKKHSDNPSVNEAERKADYWVFGGIYRPVYLEIKPPKHIERVAIDARASGSFVANVYLSGSVPKGHVKIDLIDTTGQVQTSFIKQLNGDVIMVQGKFENPRLWTPEFPNLYLVKFSLLNDKNQLLHQLEEKTGFRTVEVREQDGIYVNDMRIKLKGVNRHTFHPDYGRASSKVFSIRDVNLIKDMNMNAVRMSHYPPEKHFLDACDSLGLFVLDELAGWQTPPYDSLVGRKLLEEMIVHDVNHPSIILWDNGNEGGWNTAYDKYFKELDIQKREVVHPWSVFQKMNTAHYISYNYLALDNFAQRKIFFSTEFLHGLYDGGHGAGLEDYWNLMFLNPLCAGGFLWSFADECLYRSDLNSLDCKGNQAPDGILGPYLEKEGSFYAIREIWSPIYFEKRYITSAFNGTFHIQNRYHYTNINQCKLSYKWIRVENLNAVAQPKILAEGDITTANIQPSQNGILKVNLIENWDEADILSITARSPDGRLINTWTWPVKSAQNFYQENVSETAAMGEVMLKETDEIITLSSGSVSIEISKTDGTLKKVVNARGEIPLFGGPNICVGTQNLVKMETIKNKNGLIIKAKYEKDIMEVHWEMLNNGLVNLKLSYDLPESGANFAGVSFNYPEQDINSVTYIGKGSYRVWKNRMAGPTFGVWEKTYNNTATGYRFEGYPEFKGYYSNLYWAKFESKSNQNFSVYSKTDDLFLRLFSPENADDPKNTEVEHPKGDISFLHGIPAIGTKFKKPETLGPQSQTYLYTSKRVENGKLSMSLTFDFNIE